MSSHHVDMEAIARKSRGVMTVCDAQTPFQTL